MSTASTDVVGGIHPFGISRMVVTPPAAAARVAVAKPSVSVHPSRLIDMDTSVYQPQHQRVRSEIDTFIDCQLTAKLVQVSWDPWGGSSVNIRAYETTPIIE